eukprot:65407_1
MAHEQKEPNDDDMRKWILIAGTTNSPSYIKASDKVRDNGSYLDGITADLHNMEKFVNMHNGDSCYTLDTIIQDMKYLSKKTVIDRIKKTAKNTRKNGGIYLYYTGHGAANTGDWCFADGVVSLKEVIDAVKSSDPTLDIRIHADCCYSGNWIIKIAEFKGKYKNIYIEAASHPGKVAYDTANGGMWTLVFTSKEEKKDFKKLLRCEGGLNYYGNYFIDYIDQN